MIRTTLAILGGTLVAVVVVGLVEALGHMVWPPPEGMDPADPESIARYMAEVPPGALLSVAVAWTLGTAAGVWFVVRYAAHAQVGAAFITALMMAGGLMTLLHIPHPGWFLWVACLGFPFGAYLGLRLGLPGRREGPEASRPV